MYYFDVVVVGVGYNVIGVVFGEGDEDVNGYVDDDG